jgi:hypothetical protein
MNIQSILRTARISSWTYRLLSTAVGLVTVRLINDRVGLSGYGDLAFLLAFLTGVCAIDLGLLQSLSRFVARLQADPPQRREIFWASCILFAGAVFFLQCTLVVVLAVALGLSDQLRSLSLAEILSLGLAFIVGNLLTASSSVYAGWQRYGSAAAAKIIKSLVYLLAVLALWAEGHLSVRTVLWASALCALLPNLLLTLNLVLRHRRELHSSWSGFPTAHWRLGGEMLDYSLRGWLFTASTILVSSGAVFLSGLVMSAPAVAKLQLGLVLYTGVAAFVTGSMSPLSTIRARLSDDSPESRQKVSAAARSLTEESIVMVAMLGSFFALHIDLVLRLLIGPQAADPAVLSLTRWSVLTVLLPGLLVLPWFTFRFALVSHAENARYSQGLFLVTGALLLMATGIASVWPHPQVIAVAVGAALTYRGTLAFAMGRTVIPGLSFLGIARPLAQALAIVLAIGLGLKMLATDVRIGPVDDTWLHAAAYLLVCALLFVFRRRLRPLWGLPQPAAPGTTDPTPR